MNLVVFSHKLLRQTAVGYQTDGAFTIQMDALAACFNRLTLCVPVISNPAYQGECIEAKNIHVHSLPPFPGRLSFLRQLQQLRIGIYQGMQMGDLGLVILPGYFGTYASWLCQRANFPIFQWVIGNWSQTISARRHGLKRLFSLIWTPLLDKTIHYLTQGVLTFFNGQLLHGQNNPLHFVRFSSSVRAADIYQPPSLKHPSPPYQVLYVGRLAGEKGVSYLLDAAAQARHHGEVWKLHLVGTGELEADLRQQVSTCQLDVSFYGFVPQGEGLRQLYRQADVFVLPALQDQQPKVLTEAMSQGIPVIATNVGGIPSVINHDNNGWLIPPHDPQAIVMAVHKLMVDHDRREKLVRQGIETVRSRTVEKTTAEMMQIVRAHFGNL